MRLAKSMPTEGIPGGRGTVVIGIAVDGRLLSVRKASPGVRVGTSRAQFRDGSELRFVRSPDHFASGLDGAPVTFAERIEFAVKIRRPQVVDPLPCIECCGRLFDRCYQRKTTEKQQLS